jgi:3-dehydroquinate dehydratase-2
MKIGLLNGPNLNLLGTREPEVYGSTTLDDIVDLVTKEALAHNHEIVPFQSNHEGELIDFIQQAPSKGINYILFNPGAYTHTSIAIRDAISGTEVSVIEVHISNIHSREEFRHKSVLAPVCVGQVSGFGVHSYLMALGYLTGGTTGKQG